MQYHSHLSLFPLLFSGTGRILCHLNSLTSFSISTKKLLLPRHASVISRLRCNGQTLLLYSYRYRIGSIKNPSRSPCGHLNQDIHFILYCPATDSLHRWLFSNSFSIHDLWWLPGYWRSMVFHHAPFLGRSRVTTSCLKFSGKSLYGSTLMHTNVTNV